jgi:hypothetical protein
MKTVLILAGLMLCSFAKADTTCSYTRAGSIDTVKMECWDEFYGLNDTVMFEKISMNLYFFAPHAVTPTYVGSVPFGNLGTGTGNDAVVIIQVDYRAKIDAFVAAHNINWANVYMSYGYADVNDGFQVRPGAISNGFMVYK